MPERAPNTQSLPAHSEKFAKIPREMLYPSEITCLPYGQQGQGMESNLHQPKSRMPILTRTPLPHLPHALFDRQFFDWPHSCSVMFLGLGASTCFPQKKANDIYFSDIPEGTLHDPSQHPNNSSLRNIYTKHAFTWDVLANSSDRCSFHHEQRQKWLP